MFIALVITLAMSSPYLVWQFFIRPYCLRNGRGYTPGANWAATMWVDWHEGREIAFKKKNRKIIYACRIFLCIHLSFFAIGFLWLILAIVRS